MRSKCVLNKNNKNTNSDPITQTHKLKKKKKKKPRTQFQIQERKKKTPIYAHLLSFTQTHLKKQHPYLKFNNTNNTSLSFSSLKNVIPTIATEAKNPNLIQKPQSKTQEKKTKSRHRR